jgi:hypothetical protein
MGERGPDATNGTTSLTFILSPPPMGGEGRVRGRCKMHKVSLLLRSSIIAEVEHDFFDQDAKEGKCKSSTGSLI